MMHYGDYVAIAAVTLLYGYPDWWPTASGILIGLYLAGVV